MIKRLWIVEKPAMAVALAAGLCLAYKTRSSKQKGYHQLDNGDVVAPLQGHLLEAEFIPEHLQSIGREEYFDHLPFRHKELKYAPKAERDRATGKPVKRGGKPVPVAQFKVVSDLIRRAREIVNAGDIDREGQLIVDELLIYCGVDPAGANKPVWRLPLVSNREQDIAEQVVGELERNGDPKWVNRRLAALARQHCDMIVGANGSMAFQAASGYARMSVGRVQTPVVCLIVDRERKIRDFKPQTYYVPVITLSDGTEMRFYKRHGAEGQPGFDSEGRIISEDVARHMVRLIGSGLKGNISAANKKHNVQAAPLPFSATVLYSTVSKRTGMTPKQAEAAAQAVYEKHKAISYVGTDCQFLPTSLLNDARDVMAAISRRHTKQAQGANLSLRSKAWNDDKVDEHYAIVPTVESLPSTATKEEQAVYDAVSKRFMAQFYPAHEWMTHQLHAMFGKDEFKATRKEVTVMGWKEVEGDLEQGGPGSERAEGDTEDGVEVRSDDDRASSRNTDRGAGYQ